MNSRAWAAVVVLAGLTAACDRRPPATPPTAAKALAPALPSVADPKVRDQAYLAAFGRLAATGSLPPGALNPVAALAAGPHLAVVATATGEDDSHAASGRLVVRYLDGSAEAGFRRSSAPEVTESPTSFGALPDWKIRTDLADAPVVAASGGGAWQGQTCAWTTLVELDPDAPHELVTILTDYDVEPDSGAPGKPFKAVITRDGAGVKVAYSGAVNQTFKLHRAGAKLVSDQPLPSAC